MGNDTNTLITDLLELARAKKISQFKNVIVESLRGDPSSLINGWSKLYRMLEDEKLLNGEVDDVMMTLAHVDLDNPLSVIQARSELN